MRLKNVSYKYFTFEEYNLKNKKSFLRMDSQIPFFCGDSLECRTIGSSVALKGAIRNIQLKVGHLGFWKTKLMKSFHKLKSIIQNESFKYKGAQMDHPVRQSFNPKFYPRCTLQG